MEPSRRNNPTAIQTGWIPRSGIHACRRTRRLLRNHRPGMMQPDIGGPAQPLQGIGFAIVSIGAQDCSGAAGQSGAHLRQGGERAGPRTHGDAPVAVPEWVPTVRVPPEVVPVLGLWFWGNTALELRWQNERLELRNLNSNEMSDAFELRGERLVGMSGYHRGETLHVRPTHLECATFVYTRTPYDPAAPIPG